MTNQTEKAAATDERGSLQMVGHGSKFGRKKEAAIVALLTQRNFTFQEVQSQRHQETGVAVEQGGAPPSALTAPDEEDGDARK